MRNIVSSTLSLMLLIAVAYIYPTKKLSWLNVDWSPLSDKELWLILS